MLGVLGEDPAPSTSTAECTVRSAILDGTYFQIVKQKESGQVQAESKLCTKNIWFYASSYKLQNSLEEDAR